LFAIGADLFKRSYVESEAFAFETLAHRSRTNYNRLHFHATARAISRRQIRRRDLGCRNTATRTMLAADEHHAEARWTCHSREPRLAKLT